MKRLIALLAASLAAFIMSAAPAPITKDFNLKGFTGLHVSGLVSVELTKAPDWKVSVTLPPELEEYLVVKTSGGNLSISLNNVPAKVLRRFRDLEIKAEIAMPELRTLEMSGATSLSCGDTFDIGSETFKIEVSGASKVKQLGINAKELRAQISGATGVNLSGSFGRVYSQVSGAAKCVFDVEAETLTEEISGAAKVYNTGEYNDVNVEASGASVFSVKGSADRMGLSGSGASKMELFGCEVAKVKVDLSGAAYCEVNASESIDVNVNAAASLRYKDNPDVVVNTGNIGRGASIQRVK